MCVLGNGMVKGWEKISRLKFLIKILSSPLPSAVTISRNFFKKFFVILLLRIFRFSHGMQFLSRESLKEEKMNQISSFFC